MVFKLSNICLQKGTVVFTWDDNYYSHAEIIAPIFCRYHQKCTFYINPGEPSFCESFFKNYFSLSKQGFEISSHGNTHHHYSDLSVKEYIFQLVESKKVLKEMFNVPPTTFAFPYHDYNDKMLSQVRNIYFETRNTLSNSKRFSLKTATTLEQIQAAANDAIKGKITLVFSGHGAFSQDNLRDVNRYESIDENLLIRTLEILINLP